MLRALIATALACTVAGGASAGPHGGAAAAFVTLPRAAQVAGVDLTTGRVVARIRVPAGPTDIASFGARHLLIVSPQAASLSLVDSFEERVVHVWRGFGRPVAVATNGSYAYVADAGRSELAIVDLATRSVRRVAIRPAPVGVAVGDVVLLTHGERSPNLTVAELTWTRDRVLRFRQFRVGKPAADLARQGDSAHAYVAYPRLGRVAGVDWGTERVRWRRAVGSHATSVEVDVYHGRRLWITDRASGAVLALSTENGRILRRLRGCAGAGSTAVTGSAWVVAACGAANGVAVWSRRSWTRRLVDLGARPHGVAEVVLP